MPLICANGVRLLHEYKEYCKFQVPAWFQQDGAPPHSTNNVTNCLNAEFGQHGWIGNKSHTLGPATAHRNESIKWPARSPDLTPLDYFFWRYVKNKLYKHNNNYENIDEIKTKIREICGAITRETLEKVINEYYQRLINCSTVEGLHFEQLKRKGFEL